MISEHKTLTTIKLPQKPQFMQRRGVGIATAVCCISVTFANQGNAEFRVLILKWIHYIDMQMKAGMCIQIDCEGVAGAVLGMHAWVHGSGQVYY